MILNNLLNPNFVSGFSDAEANFYVRISKKNSMVSGWTVEPVFSIRLHHKDLNMLHLIQQFFGFYSLGFTKRVKTKEDR